MKRMTSRGAPLFVPALWLFALLCPLTTHIAAQGLPPPPMEKTPAADGNAAPGPAEFDAASIREHASDEPMRRWMMKPDGVSTTNIPLQGLIAGAYGIKMDLVSGGPAWVNSTGFDIEAKVLPEGAATTVQLTAPQRDTLLRALLAERFHLKVHIESKTLPIYELVVDKGGPKMKAEPVPSEKPKEPEDEAAGEHKAKEPGGMSFYPGHLDAKVYSIGALADQLGYIVQRTTLDKTGLTQRYSFTLDWTPDEQLQAASDKASNGATEVRPSIYAALQEQLGLKLVPAKGPVNTLVIDHVELPTAN